MVGFEEVSPSFTNLALKGTRIDQANLDNVSGE